MSKVVIAGAAGWGNVGDDLIAARLTERELDAGNEVILMGGSYPIPALDGIVHRIALTGQRSAQVKAVAAIARSSRVVIGGGGLFDDRRDNFYRPFCRLAAVSTVLRVPYDIVGVGVGPLRRKGTADHYRLAFSRAASATVRDDASRDRITSTGAPAPSVILDPALWPTSSSEPATIGYDLLVNLRQWPYSDDSRGVPLTEAAITAIASALNDHHHGSIGLVSMSTLQEDEDAVPLRQLAEKLTHGQVGVHFSGSTTEVEGVVRASRSVLTMRLHLALIGVSHNKLVAGIAYDRKVAQQGLAHHFHTAPLDQDFSAATVHQLLQSIA